MEKVTFPITSTTLLGNRHLYALEEQEPAPVATKPDLVAIPQFP